MSKGRVLVIDDDEWVCRLLAVAMREAGFEVSLTDTAADGFFRAVEEQPHCIVCDVDLPDQDGYWVARRIRQHPSKVSMAPFVFLSGLDDREHRLEGFSVGGDAYLTKPFRIDEVVAQVEALVGMAERLKRARRTLHSVPPSGPAMVGNLAQMNVATVLTMLDLERRSGRLELSHGKDKAVFMLVSGSIADASVDGSTVAALAAIRTVMAWTSGKFAFSPTEAPETPPGAAEPINALLMEAARLQDESANEEGRGGAASDRLSSAWKESMRIPRAATPPPPAASATPGPASVEPGPAPAAPTSLPPETAKSTTSLAAVRPPPATSGAPKPGAEKPEVDKAEGAKPDAPKPKPLSPLAAPRLPTPGAAPPVKPAQGKTGFGAPMRSMSPAKPMAAMRPAAPKPPTPATPKTALAKPPTPPKATPPATATAAATAGGADTPDEGWGDGDEGTSDARTGSPGSTNSSG